MTRIIAAISIIMLMTIGIGCSRHGRNEERLDLAENLMADRPDSSLAVLEGIGTGALDGKEEAARYALLKSMALDKNYIDTTTFDVLQPAIDYYLRHGSADERLRTYYYQGRIYQNKGENDSAMNSFMRGREYCVQGTDTMTMANLLVALATIQYSTYKFEDFIRNNLEAARLYRDVGRVDYEVSCLVNALDGSIIRGDRSLADSIMAIARKRANENPDLNSDVAPYVLSYTVNFGSKEDIKKIIDYYNSVDSIEDLTKVEVAEAYCKIGDAQNAKRYLDLVDTDSRVRNSLKYLAAKPNVLEMNGDHVGALAAYKDYSIITDSIHLDIFTHDLLFAKERHELEKSSLLKIQKRDRIIWVSLCVVFALLVVAGFVYHRYRLSNAKRLLEEQDNKRLQLERENLRLKIERLEDESASLKEILEKRKDLAKPIEDAIRIRVEMLNGLLATSISDNESYAKPYGPWRDKLIQDKDEFMNTTRLAFKASHPRFMEYLEQHGLTEAEINYVCLYAIGLRGKEVGEYMQLKRHYHISSDIRKKLGIDEHETNIGIYVRNLMKKL